MERQKKKEHIRENIIQAIFALLKERTWESLSSSEICEKAGVSKRTLYVYFRSQDEMYLELVRRSFEHMTDILRPAMALGETIEDKICNLGETYLRFMLENPIQGELIIGFDEKRYVNAYTKQVEAIRAIANEYELFHIFHKFNLDSKVYDSNMAIFLWAYIQGIAQLLHSKGVWMEEYYKTPIQRIIKEQINLVRIVFEGVNK